MPGFKIGIGDFNSALFRSTRTFVGSPYPPAHKTKLDQKSSKNAVVDLFWCEESVGSCGREFFGIQLSVLAPSGALVSLVAVIRAVQCKSIKRNKIRKKKSKHTSVVWASS